MADSTTPKPTAVDHRPQATVPADLSLDHFHPPLPLAVAFSGGADSTALLLACAKQWPGQVRAVHVHHGLQAAADAFARHCETLCAWLDVPLVVHAVNAKHAPGDSPEDAARQARYAAFALVLHTHWGGQIRDLALAQHADDQVETLLLALSRGAGLPGLSSMPERLARNGLVIHRPWLHVKAKAMRDWLTQIGVAWVEDPSNADTQFTRNQIRHHVMPVLENAFPSFRQTFARSARHAAQAQGLLSELAAQDAQVVGIPPVIAHLQALSAARQANLLRHWLNLRGVQVSTRQLDALQGQIAACKTRGHQIDIKVGQGYVRRSGATLDWYNE
ncbi:MAG: tRNA lysidine(34) synthetase TilS [Betaproteobacteria bacterium]|nr:tRNA lysidine(34) synthetase TilS [Betaproteobacteria bacterium]